jgi:choline dehydrogenase
VTGFDIVVVGAGSAGCVLAARLSADPQCRVMLVEAGPDYPSRQDLPTDVADASAPTLGHDWGFVAEPDELGRQVPLPRARLVGGCGATNAGFLIRGWPADYDGWAAQGNPGWSFADLLPTMRAVESDEIIDQGHGRDGPIPVHGRRSRRCRRYRKRSPRRPSRRDTLPSTTTTVPAPSGSVRHHATCVTACG